jgi:hypothetical protein
MKSSKGKISAPIKPKISTNQMISMLKMSLSDSGISFVLKYLAEPYIK